MSDQSHCEPVQDSFVDNDSSIKEDDTTYNNGRWTDSEHRKFLEAIAVYGNKWDKVKEHVLSRSTRQIRSHAQKFIMSLSKKKFVLQFGILLLERLAKNLCWKYI